MSEHRFLFGPVPSRRLGMSLGVDPVPFKTCTLDCVYCECGKTTVYEIERQEFFPVADLIVQLDQFLSSNPQLDYVTFAGSGEPTLYSKLGELINYVRSNYPQYKTALLTNGTLFYQESLIEEVLGLDLIIPSLDAATEESFAAINRPDNRLNLKRITNGLVNLRKVFTGQIWLEIFIVPGVNDNEHELNALSEVSRRINPDRVQINSLDRPGTESWVAGLGQQELQRIKQYFLPLNVEIIGKYKQTGTHNIFNMPEAQLVFETIQRRPCTIHDLAELTGLRAAELNKYLREWEQQGLLASKKEQRGIFYFPSK